MEKALAIPKSSASAPVGPLGRSGVRLRKFYERGSILSFRTFRRCGLPSVLVLAGLLISAPLMAQQSGEGVLPKFSIQLPLKIVKGEVISFKKPRGIFVSNRIIQVNEALLLKTAVITKNLDRFPPSADPRLYLGRHKYSVLRSEPSNWDLINERPLDKTKPVGEIEYVYFLIPDWTKIPARAIPILAVPREGPEESQKKPPKIDERLLNIFKALPGSFFFNHSAIVDHRQ